MSNADGESAAVAYIEVNGEAFGVRFAESLFFYHDVLGQNRAFGRNHFADKGFACFVQQTCAPGGRFGFVEVKAPGETPRPIQTSRIRLLKRLGFKVFVLDDEKQIGGILDEIRSP